MGNRTFNQFTWDDLRMNNQKIPWEAACRWQQYEAELRGNLVRLGAIGSFYIVHLVHHLGAAGSTPAFTALGLDAGTALTQQTHVAIHKHRFSLGNDRLVDSLSTPRTRLPKLVDVRFDAGRYLFSYRDFGADIWTDKPLGCRLLLDYQHGRAAL